MHENHSNRYNVRKLQNIPVPVCAQFLHNAFVAMKEVVGGGGGGGGVSQHCINLACYSMSSTTSIAQSENYG